MRRRFAAFSIVLALSAGAAWAQSLGQIADKEKERRKKNKETGKVVKVVTETDLPAADSPPPSSAGGPATTTTAPARRPSGARRSGEGGEGGDEERVTEIPQDGSLPAKLSAFESMKRSYQADVAGIDKEIAKNRTRLSAIEQELISLGATGLPTAPQADLKPYNPSQTPALQNEKTQLEARNRELEAKKESLWQDVESKARRAGVPPSYIRK